MSVRNLPAQPKASYDPNVWRWLAGFGLGLLGDQIFYIALAWTAGQVTSASMAGLIVAVGALPRALLLLVGGAVADSLGARRVAIASDATRFLTMVAFAVVTASQARSVAVLIVLGLLFGAIDAFFLPSVSALPPRIVTRAELARTQALRSVVQRLAAVGGPPLGGFLLSGYGLSAALTLNAVLFGFSLLVLMLTEERAGTPLTQDPEAVPPGHLLRDIKTGLVYIGSNSALRSMLSLIAMGEFAFSGPFSVGLILLGQDRGWTASDVGFALAAFGLGAAMSALTISVLGHVPRAGLVSLIAIFAMGPAMAGIGLSQSTVTALIFAGIAGLCSGVCATLLVSLFLLTSDQRQVGRVMSALSLATFGAAPLSYSASGLIADVLGTNVVFIACGILVSASAVAGASSRQLRALVLPHAEGSRTAGRPGPTDS